MRILKETRNMTKLITDILTISKLESQQNSVNFEPIPFKTYDRRYFSYIDTISQ